MANPSPAADLTLDPADYFAANAELYGLKVNRLSRWLPIDSRDRALAQWANLIDDFMLEAQALLYLQRTGSGSPQNAIAAPPGTVYLNTESTPTGSRLWIKASGTGTSGWSQVGLPGIGEVTLDLLEDAPAVSVLARAGNTPGARADLASGGSRRALMSDATNAAIAFRALVAADLSFLSSFGASLIDDTDAATARATLGLAAIAASGSASDLSTGTLPAARFDDTAHGARAGGTTHAVVVAAGAAGFMSGADKTKLDGIASTGFGLYPALVADVDFTAQSSATPTLNQTVSYGGLNFTWQRNTGGTELSQADVVSGTGLELRYKSSGAGSLDISNTLDTAGGIYMSLGSLTGFSELHRYLILWHVDQAGGVAGAWATNLYNARFFARVISASGIYAGTTQYGRGGSWGSNSGGAAAPSSGVNNGATNAVIRTGMPPTTYNVVGIATILGGAAVAVVAGVYSGGWPSLDSLVAVGVTESPGSGNGAQCPTNLSITRYGVWLTGSAGVANPHGVTIRRFRAWDLGPLTH